MDKSPQKAQNVLAMSDYKPETGYAAIAQVEAYWEALRGTRLLPKRSDIDPRGIEQSLENAFILERVAPGVARLRIAGTHLTELMGMEVRGMPVTALFSANARRQVSDLLEEVFQGPAIVTLTLRAAGGPGRPETEARMVLLPLKSDLGDVSRILGCLVNKGEIGLAPRRFDVVGHDLARILPGPGDAPTAAVPPAPRVPQVASGFAAPKTAFEGKPPGAAQNSKRPPYLRLIKSDDKGG